MGPTHLGFGKEEDKRDLPISRFGPTKWEWDSYLSCLTTCFMSTSLLPDSSLGANHAILKGEFGFVPFSPNSLKQFMF